MGLIEVYLDESSLSPQEKIQIKETLREKKNKVEERYLVNTGGSVPCVGYSGK